MPKKGQRVEINTFIQGLITEASPLNYPVNASIDEDNFELNRDGTRDRRLGLNLEPTFSKVNTGVSSSTISLNSVNSFRWGAVNGLTNRDFVVVQVTNKLYFFNADEPIISTNGYVGTITLSSLSTSIRFSFAALEGKLIVASGAQTIAVITYNSSANTFSATYERLKTRDVWGVQVTSSSYESDISYRGTTLPAEHMYNLQNQSWGIPRKLKTGSLTNPIEKYKTDLGVYPSNSEMVWAGLSMATATASTDPYEYMFTNLYTEALGANVKAAKGYYIIDLLDRGDSREAAFAANASKYPSLSLSTVALPTDRTPKGATCVETFAGRVFYAGFDDEVVGGDARSPILSDHIAFSMLVKSYSDVFKCHQEGDPTSRESFDLVDTDGGIIKIGGARGILALKNVESHLIVIARNGVWAISGGSDYGFTASNYKVSKISNFGGISANSVVVHGGQVFYWAYDGVYVVGKTQVGDIEVNSITDKTIKTFYDKIPSEAKETAFGAYDQYTKKIRWLYKSGPFFTSTSITRELILDLSINAFYTTTIQRSTNRDVEVVGMFVSNAFTFAGLTEAVLSGSDLVYSGTDLVVSTSNVRSSDDQSLRYVTLIEESGVVKISFSYYQDTTFVDWKALDGIGVDAKAYVLTGSQIAEDSGMEKQIPYLIMHFRKTESGVISFAPDHQSSCLVRSQWNWANSLRSNKWSPQFQAYRYRQLRLVEHENDDFDNGYETVVSKSKLRGKGKAFALYFETEPGKDCRIIGWNLTINANPIT